MLDTPKHKSLRKQMLMKLYENGFKNESVLKAMYKIPRHLYLDSVFEEVAYRIKAFPISAGQTISSPHTVAFQSSLLELKAGEKVLEIGTGCGYQSAVLIKLGAQLYTVERQKELYDFSIKMFATLKISPRYQSFGDGYQGLETMGPFDKIIVTCSALTVPTPLLKQLKIGGLMVIPIGSESQRMKVYKKKSKLDFDVLDYGECHFVPFLRNKESG